MPTPKRRKTLYNLQDESDRSDLEDSMKEQTANNPDVGEGDAGYNKPGTFSEKTLKRTKKIDEKYRRGYEDQKKGDVLSSLKVGDTKIFADTSMTEYNELKQKIIRYEEAKLGCKIKGKTSKARQYADEIKRMKKRVKDIETKWNKESRDSKNKKGASGGYQYKLDLSDIEKVQKKLYEATQDNKFYVNDLKKISKAVGKGQGDKIIFSIDEYSSSYKGGILMYQLPNKEPEQLTKKKIKIGDLKYYLPFKDI